MDRKTFRALAILALVAVLLAMAGVVSRRGTTDMAALGEPFLAGLLDAANDVARVVVRNSRDTLTLERRDGLWTLAERDGHPARVDRVRSLVLGLAELRRFEAKTSQPEQYKMLGVEAPDAKDSASHQVTILDGGGKALADVILGRPKLDLGGGERGLYVRRADQAQAWLVKGQADLGLGAADWLEREIVDLGEERVASVTVLHPDGKVLVASRAGKDDKALKAGGKPMEGLHAAFAKLVFDDVRKADAVEMDEKFVTVIQATAFDGLKVTLRVGKLLEEYWGWISAEGGDEAAAIAARTRPWVYRIPAFKAMAMIRQAPEEEKPAQKKTKKARPKQ